MWCHDGCLPRRKQKVVFRTRSGVQYRQFSEGPLCENFPDAWCYPFLSF